MKLKKLMSLACATVILLGSVAVLGGCGKETDTTATTAPSATSAKVEVVRFEVNSNVKHDTKNKIGYQLELPENGEEIAIIHTNMGDITLRLFPENAPKTVENFVTLAKEGKYDNTIFHRVIDNFMIQGGDYENSNGTGGKSIYGAAFEDEFCDTLYNIRGSVAMANSGENTNGSQFFINQAKAENFDRNITDYDSAYQQMSDVYQQYIDAYGTEVTSLYPTLPDFINNYCGGINPLSYAVSDEVLDFYSENGGNIHLDGALRAKGGHTVFAQVIDGMDVVDAIAKVKVDSSNKPAEDVIVEYIEITYFYAE